jgi:hypothetical protein
MDRAKGISLETLGQGAAVERFNLALKDVLDNIQDVNTDAKTARAVTLKVTFKPSEDREVGKVTIDIGSKLAPIAPMDIRVFMGREADGGGYALEHHPQQSSIFDDPIAQEKTADNVLTYGKEVKAQ